MIHKVKRVKPLCGLLWAQEISYKNIIDELVSVIGEMESNSPAFHFSFTDYYTKEMGKDLKKCFVSFVQLVNPGQLSSLKIRSNIIEKNFTVDGKRKINVDPGYLTGAKLVLASTKDFAHRIYLSDGIYGDVQLRYIRGHYRSSPWTYPDYKTDLALTFFEQVRLRYIKQEKQSNDNEGNHSV